MCILRLSHCSESELFAIPGYNRDNQAKMMILALFLQPFNENPAPKTGGEWVLHRSSLVVLAPPFFLLPSSLLHIPVSAESMRHPASSPFRLLDDALKMFDEMPQWGLESLNATISGFAQNGLYREALEAFKQVGACGFSPNSVCLTSVLPACKILEHGIQVHCLAWKLGLLGNVFVATSVLTMYSKHWQIISATRMFEEIEMKNIVSYNTMICGLVRNGAPLVALNVFKEMKEFLDQEPNSVTFVSLLSACSSLLYVKFGMQIHGIVLKIGKGVDSMVGTSLIGVYSKGGYVKQACDIFRTMDGCPSLITWNAMIWGMMLNGKSGEAVSTFHRLCSNGLRPDSVTWNSVICGLAHLGKWDQAFMFFDKMQCAGMIPSLETITSVVTLCSVICNFMLGKSVHAYVLRNYTNCDEYLSTSLINMYMNSGNSTWARRVFDRLDIVCADPAVWNAMIFGYARNGENEPAFELFSEMDKEKVTPNSITLSGILCACSQSGDVERGWKIFRMIRKDYGLCPTLEQYGCMVDLLGRCGRLSEAQGLIREIPECSASLLASLLSACQRHSDSQVGQETAKKLMELEPLNPTPLVVLSNIYAADGRWSDSEQIRDMIRENRLEKYPGCSFI